ncbi:ptype atpase [Phytophthora cinnamomi]|uniref:ptype atpase n=1 Tax=Phytophthora cinnamomi TaxID=4785 RepID=UPI0035594A61|nr:ptype atpase [Phytophthora cinnamomi]
MTDKVKPEAAADAAVILISDDEHDKPKNSTRPRRAASSALASVLSDSDSDSDSDVKLEEILSSVSSATKSDAPNKLAKANKAKTPPRPARSKKARSRSIADYFSTPEKTPDKAVKRRATSGPFSTPPTNQSGGLKPITPSSTLQSSMNASLVFDMVTSLSTNDPGVAIATLRSIVVLGKEYPSDLLYAELIDRIQSHEAIAYNDAVAIYAALVFVFDKAASCSCDLTFPSQWEPLGTALQEVSGNGRVGDDGLPKKDESWRRNLLVVQFFIYCFQQDFHSCRSRYERLEGRAWVQRTRLFLLLQSDGASASSSAKARAKSRAKSNKLRNNNLIFQAIGWSLQLWKRVYDENGKPKKKSANTDEDGDAKLFLQQEGEQACLSVVRLIEMLYLCTDQQVNALQRMQVGLAELTQPTRIKFSQTLQSPALRTQLATTMIGLSNKSRSKETEWYECNALGRVQLAMNPDTTSDVAHTDGYSWSHFDSFANLKPQSNLTKLLQEISRMQSQ